MPYYTTRAMTYDTRRLKAGDEMPRLSERDGELLVRLGKATRAPAILANVTKQPDPLTEARLRYENVVGKRAYHAWDIDELERRIAEHGRDTTDDES